MSYPNRSIEGASRATAVQRRNRRRFQNLRQMVPPERLASEPLASGGVGGADPPSGDGEPPLERCALALARVAATAVLVSDSPDAEDVLRVVLGMTSRQLRDFVSEHGIPHGRRHERGKHIYVRVADVVAAFGLPNDGPAPASSPQPEPSWDEATVIELAARPKGGAS